MHCYSRFSRLTGYHCAPSSFFGLVYTLTPTVADSMPLNSESSTVIIVPSLTAFARVKRNVTLMSCRMQISLIAGSIMYLH